MAFLNRFGGLMKQTGPQSCVSMLNAVRYMSTNLFIGNLSFKTDDYSLKEAFSSFGDIIEARVIIDRESGRSRGFGFVTYASDGSAKEALTGMDGQELDGRNIRVSYAESPGSFRPHF